MIDLRALSFLALLAAGCADPKFDHLEFRQVSDAPGIANLRPKSIQIEKGIAVRARVSAIGDDDEPMDAVNLASEDEQIFSVDPGPNLGEWVFTGVEVGTSALDVESNHHLVASLPVEVLAPK